MSNVVLAYPTLNQTDFEWIQAIRSAEDRLFEAVQPHFTFVFPSEKLSVEDLADHTELKMRGQQRIAFTLTKVILVEDDSRSFYHVFLVPSLGKPEITALHDLLYTDALASELRADIPYIPHISIATIAQKIVAQELVDRLNSERINIKGVIDGLTVCSYDGIRVKDITRLPLADRAKTSAESNASIAPTLDHP
ncbi:2'-5' RNA ligase family protein [Mycobacterium sp.]|uniref:2'-5' RNA ligase family protein n=1 Tax=Mycobacterium sp. TaxID=1785 RepID=UPI002B5C4818|nr:2'-5' RNA ligase family protein [Mycobacterium sp.]HTQ16113.1 2'-5' RNA ligase family protein [Mycobacterium sp.]